MTTLAKPTAVQASIIHSARKLFSDDERKAIKASVFADVKRTFGISSNHKLKASVDKDADSYCVVHVGDSAGMAYRLNDSGLWDGTLVSPDAVAQAPAVDTRKWFRVSLDRLVQLHKDDSFLDADDAADDLPPGIDHCPGADAIAHDGDVYFLAEPDNT